MRYNPVYVAVLWDNRFKQLEVHKFTMEPEGKSRYRASISWNYFRKRESEKSLGKIKYIFRTHGMSLSDYEGHIEAETRVFAPNPSPLSQLPHFEHESIWDMYEALGYCYKRKRYIRQSGAAS